MVGQIIYHYIYLQGSGHRDNYTIHVGFYLLGNCINMTGDILYRELERF